MRALPILPVLLALLMPACATPPAPGTAAAPAPGQPVPPAVTAAIEAAKQAHEPGGCFYGHTVDRWRLLDSGHVLLYAPTRSKPWLVEFSNACPLLREGDPIALDGLNGQVCDRSGARLRARNQDCGIKHLYAITPDAAQQLLDARYPPQDTPLTEAP